MNRMMRSLSLSLCPKPSHASASRHVRHARRDKPLAAASSRHARRHGPAGKQHDCLRAYTALHSIIARVHEDMDQKASKACRGASLPACLAVACARACSLTRVRVQLAAPTTRASAQRRSARRSRQMAGGCEDLDSSNVLNLSGADMMLTPMKVSSGREPECRLLACALSQACMQVRMSCHRRDGRRSPCMRRTQTYALVDAQCMRSRLEAVVVNACINTWHARKYRHNDTPPGHGHGLAAEPPEFKRLGPRAVTIRHVA